MVLVAVTLISALSFSAAAAPADDTFDIPAGQTAFSIDVYADEATPYAGIMFALSISNESAVKFDSFTPALSGATAAPFLKEGNLYYFGFYSGSNAFTSGGSDIVGTMNFTGYSSNQALNIIVEEMEVIRLTADKKTVVTIKDSPAFSFSVLRENVAYYTVTFDPAGGDRSGGGALEQKVVPGDAADAPDLYRSGYIFDGWDPADFSNITEDLTVTALWRINPSGNYTVTFDPNGGERIGGGDLVQEVISGRPAIAPLLTRTGYTFDKWEPAIFDRVMSDMTIVALWKENAPNTFTVTFNPNGGMRTGGGQLSQNIALGNNAVAPTLAPRSGYTYAWDVAFTNIRGNLIVTAIWTSITGGGSTGDGGGSAPAPTPTPIPAEEIEEEGPPLGAAFPFTDVLTSNWFYGDVYYMWEHELMNGTAATLFSPNDLVKRGMVVTVLYRMEGEPDVSGLENPFGDVADGMYYTEAVIWAASKGIVRGYSETQYGPNDNVTREQLAAILFRYQEFADKIPPDVNEPIEFDDESSISEYALEPVGTLVTQGVINGKDNNMFDPKGNATRAEFAAMLHRYLLAIETETEAETEE